MHLTEKNNTVIARYWVHCKQRHEGDVTSPLGEERVHKHLPSPNNGFCFSIAANAQAEWEENLTSINLNWYAGHA
jgi:hypothetical protein